MARDENFTQNDVLYSPQSWQMKLANILGGGFVRLVEDDFDYRESENALFFKHQSKIKWDISKRMLDENASALRITFGAGIRLRFKNQYFTSLEVEQFMKTDFAKPYLEENMPLEIVACHGRGFWSYPTIDELPRAKKAFANNLSLYEKGSLSKELSGLFTAMFKKNEYLLGKYKS